MGFLARRHKVAGRGTHRFSLEVVYGELGQAALLIVGDVDQLPSVGPGQVLADMID